MKKQSLARSTVFLGKYKNKRKLGKGAFGDVFLVEDQEGNEFALKIINKKKMGDNEGLIDYLKGEISCMQHMDFKHIVKMIQSQSDEEYEYMVLQYCDGGDLINLQVGFPDKVFPLDKATQYLSQVILGLEELHNNDYLHRDIKMQNVLIKNDGPLKILKIADFGFAKKQINIMGTVLGTEQYMSPQIYRCGFQDDEDVEAYGFQVDMWAFGVLFFYMLNASYPFEIHPAWKIQNKYAEMVKQANGFSYRKVVEKSLKKKTVNCTNEMEDLFKKIFSLDINYRITFAEIRKHPVFIKHFPHISEQSMITYKKKYVSKILQIQRSNKKGINGSTGNTSAKKKEQDNLGLLPSICEADESKSFPREKNIIALELQEVNFLINIVNDLESVEKHLNPLHTLMFAYNVVKYHIILFRKFLNQLVPANYVQKYKGLSWQAYFQSQEFNIDKRGFERQLKKTELMFEELDEKCRKSMHQISQENDSFPLAYNKNQVITETEFEGNFFRSYRKSTDILYSSIKEYLKTNKILKLYYFLCIVCICHVFSDFVDDPHLKIETFSSYLQQETQKTPIFSYQRFIYYLQKSGKEGCVKLAKRIIEECMSR